MIAVYMLQKGGHTVGFEAAGHAMFREAGSDIVCSAVSALTQTAVLGLTELLELELDLSIDEEEGICCRLKPGLTPGQQQQAQLILDTMWIGLRSIEESYAENLRVCERSV